MDRRLALALKEGEHSEDSLMSISGWRPFIFVITLGLAPGAAAQAPAGECFETEIDPSTKRVYQNKAQWEADRKELWTKAPATPNLFRLKRGYDVSLEESKKSRGIGSDKRKHCYVGCRIANEVGVDVALYAGVYKEDKDITDCNIKTHYDLKDIDATVNGAEIAEKNPGRADAEYCREECRQIFKK